MQLGWHPSYNISQWLFHTATANNAYPYSLTNFVAVDDAAWLVSQSGL